MTYAEYLKSLGASDEDVKTLDAPVARKAWEKQQADLVAAEKARDDAQRLKKQTDDWYYEKQVPEYQTMQNKVVAAQAEAERYKAALRAAEKEGLVNVAKDLGIDVEVPVTPPKTTPDAIDTSKFVDRDTLLQVAQREGDAIAIAQDIAAEHGILFPGQRLSFRELRKEAMEKKISVEQHWMDKFGVAKARADKEAKDRSAYEAKLREEGAAAVRAEYAAQGNPDVRPAGPSRAPWTQRAATDTMRSGKQPWDAPSEHTLSDDRVKRAMVKAVQ